MSDSDEPREKSKSQKILDGVLLTLDARKVESFIEQRDAIVEMLNLNNMPVIAAVLAEVAALADVPGASLLIAEQDALDGLAQGRYRQTSARHRLRLAAIHVVEMMRLKARGAV